MLKFFTNLAVLMLLILSCAPSGSGGKTNVIHSWVQHVEMAVTLESCDQIPWVSEARTIVNEVIEELAVSQ